MVRKKLKSLTEYYVYMRRKRVQLFSWKWRIAVILLTLLLSAYVYDLVNEKYFVVVEAGSQTFLLSDKLFSWFMTGLLMGVLALGLMYEGELLINWRRVFKDFEGEVGDLIGLKTKRRALKRRKAK